MHPNWKIFASGGHRGEGGRNFTGGRGPPAPPLGTAPGPAGVLSSRPSLPARYLGLGVGVDVTCQSNRHAVADRHERRGVPAG